MEWQYCPATPAPMRKPLTPLQAFAEDARNASERASDAGDALIPWLSVAQSADQLSSVTGPSRSLALKAAQTLLHAFATERPSMRHDARPAPADQLGQVAEQFRVAAEAMEKAGCFELAYTTVSAICRLTARADYVSAALATVHLGRIARQMNELSTAEDCYATMLNTSMRKRDGPLAARGHIGLALLLDMRGNLPAAEAEYLKALGLAIPGLAAHAAASQGLMTLAISGGRLADALIYGWQLYDATENDPEARMAVLSDLSVVALHAGFFAAALQGFEHALTLSKVARVRLDALAGAIRAAARVGASSRVEELDRDVLVCIARANLPHGEAFALLCAAEAWAVIGNRPTALERLNSSLDVSNRHGFNEYRFRADALSETWKRDGLERSAAEAVVTATPMRGTRREPAVDAGMRRLEALSV